MEEKMLTHDTANDVKIIGKDFHNMKGDGLNENILFQRW